jgi:hypothetical protein
VIHKVIACSDDTYYCLTAILGDHEKVSPHTHTTHTGSTAQSAYHIKRKLSAQISVNKPITRRRMAMPQWIGHVSVGGTDPLFQAADMYSEKEVKKLFKKP